MTDRSREAEEFFAAVDDAPPGAVSACAGWTTHEVAAHVTGIAVEVVRHLEPYLRGDPVPETRSFEEREAPLRATGHRELLGRMAADEERMRQLVDEILEREPDAVIPWTGRQMAVAKFVPHLRNEHALHRWDIAGDDDRLGTPDLVSHSVGELGGILLRAGRRHDPAPEEDFAIRLRTAAADDLRVVVADGTAGLEWATEPDPDEPGVELDAGARHLFIWGRRPDGRGSVRSDLEADDLDRLQALLSGY